MAHGLLTGTLPRENAFDERDWRVGRAVRVSHATRDRGNVRALDVRLDAEALAEIDRVMAGAVGQTDLVPGRHHMPRAD